MFEFVKKSVFHRINNFIKFHSCISMKNQECKVRPEIINVNSKEPVFYSFSIKTSKCSGSCNNINDLYAKIYVPDFVKKLNLKYLIQN